MSRLETTDLEATYDSGELVGLALGGHFVISEAMDGAVRRIAREFGVRGRASMCQLPPLRQYPTDGELVAWRDQLLALEQTLIASRPPSPPDDRQPELPFP